MKTMKKLSALLLAAGMALSLAACGSSEKASAKQTEAASEASSEAASEASAESGSASGEDLREINIVLDWYPNAVHEWIYLAIEKGYYAEEGLKVNVQFPSGTADALSLTAAGKAELGIYYPHDVIQARLNQNVPVKAIGSICQGPLNIILSLEDKGIHSPADLKDKTIGYSGTELSEAMVKAMMDDAGVDYSSVNMIDVGFDLMSSMTTGNVDATIGCMLNHEVPQMEEEGFKVSWFNICDYGVPNYPELVLVANDRTIEEDSDLLAAFLRASAKGFADMKADPDAAVQTLLANQNAENFPLSETVETQSTNVLLPVMETDSAPFLSTNSADWEASIQWMKDQGLIDEACDISDVVADIPLE